MSPGERNYGYNSRPNKIRYDRQWRSIKRFEKPHQPEQRYSEPTTQDYLSGQYQSQSDEMYNIDYSREDILSEYDEGYEWGVDEYHGEFEPLHEHDMYEPEYESSYEHWMRSRYAGPRSVPTEWSGEKLKYRRPGRSGAPPPPPPPEYYGGENEFAYAPDYYKERYMPEEDYLQKLYLLMFRNIEYDIKVPIMQLIATVALFIIFISNYHINFEYVIALSNFSPWIEMQPPIVAAILGGIFGLFLYLFPTLDRDLRRVVIIGTIILLIIFFSLPPIWVALSEPTSAAIGKAFAESLIEFLKLAAVLVYWAPIFLGVYGIWSRNSFYIGVSAMFLFLNIIMLDIYLLYDQQPILKEKADWAYYAVFSIILFCYIEMSDSAVTFARLTSTANQEEIDPSYYDHLDRILKKYFVYFILLTIFITILTWLTMNLNTLLGVAGSAQLAESLELSSIYGIIISLIIIGIIIIFIGYFIKHEQVFRRFLTRIYKFILPDRPQRLYAPAHTSRRNFGKRRYDMKTENERFY